MDEKVRFGGKEVNGVYRFEVTGGALALDFANTLNNRDSIPRETLTTYQRLLDWSAQSGALPDRICAALSEAAGKAPRRAGQALKEALHLRELIFALFAGTVQRTEADDALLDEFNQWIGKANAKIRLIHRAGAFSWQCDPQADDLRAMLWPVVRSAVSLLTDKRLLARVKICEGKECAWLFLDTSRPGNKRWCDMTVCGNRAKASRYRKRHRAPGRSRPSGA